MRPPLSPALMLCVAMSAVGCSVDVQGLEVTAALDSAAAAPGNGDAIEAGGDGDIPGPDGGGNAASPEAGGPGGGGNAAPPEAGGPGGVSDAASNKLSSEASLDDGAPSLCANGANGSNGCVGVPPGWSLVAFAVTQSSPCPAGFHAAPMIDLVEGPDATAACACAACTMVAPPSCAAGAVIVSFAAGGQGRGGACTMTASSPLSNSPAGSCGTDVHRGNYSGIEVEFTAPPPSGGACTAQGLINGAAVAYAAHDRVCTPDSAASAGCTGGVCNPALAGAYAACIAAPGAVACPPGPLAVRHLAGLAASFSCGPCSCTLSSTCSGTITLFTDRGCTNGANAIATGQCTAIQAQTAYGSYEYQGDAPQNVACQTGPPGPAQNVGLLGEETICCAQ